jgi:hypothetical protein
VGRVTNIHSLNGSGANLANYTYTYDLAGRLSTDTSNGTLVTYNYDTDSQLITDNTGVGTYTFDGAGDRTATGAGSYGVGPDNQLTSDPVWTTYLYDSEENRTKRSKGASAETWLYAYDNRDHLISAFQLSTGTSKRFSRTLDERPVAAENWRSCGATLSLS